MVSAGLDRAYGLSGFDEIGVGRLAQERAQVVEVLRTPAIVASEQLERHQVTDAGYGDTQPREDFDGVRPASDLGLDARRCKQEVHDDPPRGATGCNEACRRKAADAVLLDRRQN